MVGRRASGASMLCVRSGESCALRLGLGSRDWPLPELGLGFVLVGLIGVAGFEDMGCLGYV
jgi:hypothetical protein